MSASRALDSIRGRPLPRLRGDDGSMLPYVIILLAVLLIFSALSVDVGAAYAARRQAQSAADAGVLGGAYDLYRTSGGPSAALAAAMTWANSNYGSPTPTAADWAACTDSEGVARGFTPIDASVTPCVSLNQADPYARGQQLRVKLPQRRVGTAFTQVFHITLDASAAAEVAASVQYPAGVLPFGVGSPAGDAAALCLKLGAGNLPSTPWLAALCENGITGNYGMLDFSLYGSSQVPANDTTVQTRTACANSSGSLAFKDRIGINVAVGVDHPLGTSPDGVSRVVDVDGCTSGPDYLAYPDTVSTQTGNNANATQIIEDGFFRSVTDPRSPAITYPGRLATSTGSGLQIRTGVWVDNTALWSYIDPGLNFVSPAVYQAPGYVPAANDAPAECKPDHFGSTPWPYGTAPWRTTTAIATMNQTIAFPAGTPDASPEHMLVCLDRYVRPTAASWSFTSVLLGKDTDGDGTTDLESAKRLAWVPYLWTGLPNGNADVVFKKFAPVYVNTFFFKCNSGGGCDTIWSAGSTPSPAPPVNGNKKLDAVAAFQLQLSMLPEALRSSSPANREFVTYSLTR